ncbi:hypothetical protein GPJ56_010074 [Histomonas meleagridis]|uniref:uncharacterized protein n=1 Tax=Histomonas meleagridis TaxID=135588 RepID=UPI00355A0EBE|nr:hypothetical protein GPJ56_010074 [Histomonas meleagridis]KAH0805860.1 hypothetical protein GO595_001350 [Histomonas meleagridis]
MRVIKTISLEDTEVTSIFWSSKGLVSGALNGSVLYWPTDDSPNGGMCHIGEMKEYSDHSLAVTSVCIVGDYLVSSSLDGKISKIQISDSKISSISSIKDPCVLSPIGSSNLFLVGTATGTLYKLSIDSDTIVSSLDLFKEAICSIAEHPTNNESLILSSSELKIVNHDTMQVTQTIDLSGICCTCVSISDDGLTAVITATDGSVRVIDLVSFKQVGCIVFDGSELHRIQPIEFGRRFVVAGADGRVSFVNLEKMLKEKGLKIGSSPILALAVQKEKNIIAVAGFDGNITFLDYE